MNRQLTALFAAFEAALVVAIGVAIPLVPLTLLWGIQYELAIDWTAFWRAALDVWLIGHGVDVTFTLDATTAASLALPGADQPFTVTVALLGFALVTVLLGVRAGRRVSESSFTRMGLLVSLATFALLSLVLTVSATKPSAHPSLWQGIVLPTLTFGIGLGLGVLRASTELQLPAGAVRHWWGARSEEARAVVVTAVRGGAAAAASVLLLASVVTAVTIALSYARIISLYESLHAEVLGGIAVTLGQIAFLPNLLVYSASWLTGPGFAVGTGSAVSPLATQLGPIPAFPLLGALPQGQLAFGFVGLLVPVVSGFIIGAVVGAQARGTLATRHLLLTGLLLGAVGGLVLGLLAWASAGSAGPGRLVDIGPNPLSVAGWAALELSASAVLGLIAGRRGKVSITDDSHR